MNPLEAREAGKKAQILPKFPPDYNGGKLWCVEHPDHSLPLMVGAPNEAAALVAAANVWDEQFQSWRYHGRAIARRIK